MLLEPQTVALAALVLVADILQAFMVGRTMSTLAAQVVFAEAAVLEFVTCHRHHSNIPMLCLAMHRPHTART